MGNTWETPTGNVSDPLVFLENDLKIHVPLAALAVEVASEVSVAVAVASLNDLKIQLTTNTKLLLKLSKDRFNSLRDPSGQDTT